VAKGDERGQVASMVRRLAGRWRIVEMDLWDQDAIDLVGLAFIEFGTGGRGRLRFVAVEGDLDSRHSEREGMPSVEFSGEGNDDCDPVSGRGWACLDADGSLRGRIFVHAGDDSGFRALPKSQRS
jgi:hypothetical protein